MECRNTLIVGILLASGLLGCTTLGGSNSLAQREPIFPFDDKDLKGDHKPHAATFVAYGNFHCQAAAEIAHSAAERDSYFDLARRSYQKALELEPGNLLALTALARLYVTLGDHDHAVRTYEQAIQANPREASIPYEFGMYYAKRKEWEPALQYLKVARGLDVENRLYARSEGFCLARAGNYEEGFGVLAKIDGEALAHYNIARMLHHVKEDGPCREHLQMALQAQPELIAARQMLAEMTPPQEPKAVASSHEAPPSPAELSRPKPLKGEPNSSLPPKTTAKDDEDLDVGLDELEAVQASRSDGPAPAKRQAR